MDSPTPAFRRRLLLALFVAICLAPLGFRAAHPSVFSDDVTRIGQLQTAGSLREILFVPFNEHMAPVFQTVSWVTWNLAGRSLTSAALAFTMASFVPHLLSLLLLGIFVRRELGSATTALVAVAAFGLSGTITETFAWYSASSFTWAMLGVLSALDAAGRSTEATGTRRLGWLVAAAFAAFLAPAGSGIGLLAGPLAAIRLVLAGTGPGWKSRLGGVLPPVGTVLNVAVCSLFRYRDVLAGSLGTNVDVGRALRNIGCAPVDVLLPGFFGRPSVEPYLPDPVALTVSAVMLIAGLVWAARDARHRGLIAVGIGLIVGGYALTFGLRSFPGSTVVLEIERYQLFPQLGAALLMSVAARPWLARFDTTPIRTANAAVVAAMALFLVQLGPIREHAGLYRWPEQAKTLAAIEGLGETCRREGITRDQGIAAMEPIRARWFNNDFNAMMMLPLTVRTPRRADTEVRAILLASLGRSEREALCGGMVVSRYLTQPEASEPIAVGRLVRTFGVRESGAPGRWDATGFASHLEFDLSAATPEDRARARFLAVPVAGPVEVWWAGDGEKWSAARSVRWWPPQSAEPTDRAVPLDRLPHWDGARVRRVRIAPRRAGELAAGAPRLLR